MCEDENADRDYERIQRNRDRFAGRCFHSNWSASWIFNCFDVRCEAVPDLLERRLDVTFVDDEAAGAEPASQLRRHRELDATDAFEIIKRCTGRRILTDNWKQQYTIMFYSVLRK